MDGHTPLPWGLNSSRNVGPVVMYWLNDNTSVGTAIKGDAEFIVRAVNSHYALVEALTELEAAVLDGLCNSGIPGFDPERLERARAFTRAALALASKEN